MAKLNPEEQGAQYAARWLQGVRARLEGFLTPLVGDYADERSSLIHALQANDVPPDEIARRLDSLVLKACMQSATMGFWQYVATDKPADSGRAGSQ